MKKIVVCLFLLFAVVSCKSTMPTVTSQENTSKTVTKTVHDTIFKIEKDSSTYKAYLDCVNGKVSIVNPSIENKKGKNLSIPKVVIKDNYITVDCQLKEQELYAKWKQTNTAETITKVNTVVQEVNKLTFWQEFQIYGFRIFAIIGLLIGLLIGAYFGIKTYLKTI